MTVLYIEQNNLQEIEKYLFYLIGNREIEYIFEE
jgi:hypothetical protein